MISGHRGYAEWDLHKACMQALIDAFSDGARINIESPSWANGAKLFGTIARQMVQTMLHDMIDLCDDVSYVKGKLTAADCKRGLQTAEQMLSQELKWSESYRKKRIKLLATALPRYVGECNKRWKEGWDVFLGVPGAGEEKSEQS
jgi:hypothetical protein